MRSLNTSLWGVITTVVLFSAACDKTDLTGSKQKEHTSTSQAIGLTASQNKVAKIIFIGQKHACDCTRGRIEATWNTLNDVLMAKPGLLVERIQRDANAEETAKMSKIQPLMVVPGVYFLDSHGNLVKLLQGEVSKEQIEKVLL